MKDNNREHDTNSFHLEFIVMFLEETAFYVVSNNTQSQDVVLMFLRFVKKTS